MGWTFFVVLCALIFGGNSSRGDISQIKINEPRSSYSGGTGSTNTGGTDSGGGGSTTQYRDPHSETENSDIVTSSVVEYLTARKGEVIEGTHDKYTYKLDLFNKVEQSENWYSWNLGIFDKWGYCDSTAKELCLIFSDGQICGSGVGRASYIHFVCDIDDDKDDTTQHLYDVTEPLTCSYHLKLYIPEICELIAGNIENIFAESNFVANSDNNLQLQQKTNNKETMSSNSVNVIGDTSEITRKLNEIINQQNNEKKLDKLWKLCLMSLLIDNDDDKLTKIQNAANMLTSNKDDTDDTGDVNICDFYLEQMLLDNKDNQNDVENNGNDNDVEIEQNIDDVTQTDMQNSNSDDNVDTDDENEEQQEETEPEETAQDIEKNFFFFENEEEEEIGGDATGGLIGDLLSNNNDDSGNEIIFQSGG